MRLWPFENAVVLVVLAATAYLGGMPASAQTLGWALGAFALHTARSHAGRLREDAGRPEDWTGNAAGWMAGGAAVLVASAEQRVLLLVPLAVWVAHSAYRGLYRVARPVRPPSHSREDD